MTDTRYYSRLPKSCARELFAFLEHLRFWQMDSRDEWISLSQSKMAVQLGVSARTVQRWERALTWFGLLEVQHRMKWNRRKLRLRPLAELPAVLPNASAYTLREWRHACRYSGDTRVVSVANRAEGASLRACARAGETSSRASQPNRVQELNPHTPTARQARGSGVGGERARSAGLGAATAKAVADLEGNLGVWRKRHGELVAIAESLQRELGERGAVECLAWARAKVRAGGTHGSEGARFLGLLSSRLLRLQERSAPRARAVARV